MVYYAKYLFHNKFYFKMNQLLVLRTKSCFYGCLKKYFDIEVLKMMKKIHNHFVRSIFHLDVDNAIVATLEYKCMNICLDRIREQ
jgi:hypothetical protein